MKLTRIYMITKSGFTLIELVVVMAIFGFLAVVATNFLLATVATNTRITIENEVRQNAQKIMQDMSSEIKKAACVYFDNNTLTISDSSAAIGTNCSVVGNVVTFDFAGGVVTKNGKTISSDKVVFCTTTSTCGGSCTGGIVVLPQREATSGSVDITLNARQANPTTRIDSCAKITLTETVTPRNVGN